MSQQSVQNVYMRMALQATPGGETEGLGSGPVLPLGGGCCSVSHWARLTKGHGFGVAPAVGRGGLQLQPGEDEAHGNKNLSSSILMGIPSFEELVRFVWGGQ